MIFKNKNKTLSIIFLSLYSLALLSVPILARAAAFDIPCTPTAYPIQPEGSTVLVDNTDLFDCVNQLYKYALIIASITAVFMIIIAGYMYIFSGGDSGKVSSAKSFITTSLLGITVLLTGFLLLKQINPNLLSIKNITPGQISQRDWGKIDDDWDYGAGGTGGNLGGQGINGNNNGPSGHTASELQCGYQGNKANYVPYMTETLFQAIKQLCAEVKAKGLTATISSISTGHLGSPGSLHNRGCAVDFAGGDANFVNHPTGQAIIAAARSLGLRINPGSDADQTFHVHVDVGIGNCTAPVLPISSRT